MFKIHAQLNINFQWNTTSRATIFFLFNMNSFMRNRRLILHLLHIWKQIEDNFAENYIAILHPIVSNLFHLHSTNQSNISTIPFDELETIFFAKLKNTQQFQKILHIANTYLILYKMVFVI